MKLELMVQVGQEPVSAADILAFNQDRCVIGRHRSDIWLSDVRCSKQHAVIYDDETGQMRIRDLGSRNGTFVNGQRVADTAVKVGDEIRVGRTCLVILDFRSPQRGTTLLGVQGDEVRSASRDHTEVEVDSSRMGRTSSLGPLLPDPATESPKGDEPSPEVEILRGWPGQMTSNYRKLAG
jgi:hypothetical protein